MILIFILESGEKCQIVRRPPHVEKIEAVNDIISSALQTVLIRAWVKMILMLLSQMRMPPFLILASIMTQL